MPETAPRIIVSGYVQGVGFRYFVYREAVSLGLTGYTQNLPTGQVEVIACGEQGLVNELIDILRVGPRYASVSDVSAEPIELKEKFRNFNIR